MEIEMHLLCKGEQTKMTVCPDEDHTVAQPASETEESTAGAKGIRKITGQTLGQGTKKHWKCKKTPIQIKPQWNNLQPG